MEGSGDGYADVNGSGSSKSFDEMSWNRIIPSSWRRTARRPSSY
jgi:hypothetical protein